MAERGDTPPSLVCSLCRVDLPAPAGEAIGCPGCGRRWPVVAGIPDLRVTSDRYLDLTADRAKAEALAALDGLSFAELVEEYWRRTPEVPPELAARYTANVLAGVARADWHLDQLGRPLAGATLLDVGCGTGALVEAAARRGAVAVGVDIALRWLVVARRRLEEAGLDARLVAADGVLLPFHGDTFDVVTCVDTLEHTADARGLLQSALLSVRDGGRFHLVTANRFSLAPEPTVGLWGLGYLPRRWTAAYVRRRRSTRYQFVRPRSGAELRAFVGLRDDVIVGAAALPPAHDGRSPARRAAEAVYDRARRTPAGRRALTAVAPFLQVSGTVGRARTAVRA